MRQTDKSIYLIFLSIFFRKNKMDKHYIYLLINNINLGLSILSGVTDSTLLDEISKADFGDFTSKVPLVIQHSSIIDRNQVTLILNYTQDYKEPWFTGNRRIGNVIVDRDNISYGIRKLYSRILRDGRTIHTGPGSYIHIIGNFDNWINQDTIFVINTEKNEEKFSIHNWIRRINSQVVIDEEERKVFGSNWPKLRADDDRFINNLKILVMQNGYSINDMERIIRDGSGDKKLFLLTSEQTQDVKNKILHLKEYYPEYKSEWDYQITNNDDIVNDITVFINENNLS